MSSRDKIPGWDESGNTLAGRDGRQGLEARAGLESLDEMLERQSELMKEYAPLAALHAHDGLFDAFRRQLRGVIGTEIRARPLPAGQKAPGADVVEDMACADSRYLAILDQGLKDRIKTIELRHELDKLGERIQSRKEELRAYTKELGLQ